MSLNSRKKKSFSIHPDLLSVQNNLYPCQKKKKDFRLSVYLYIPYPLDILCFHLFSLPYVILGFYILQRKKKLDECDRFLALLLNQSMIPPSRRS